MGSNKKKTITKPPDFWPSPGTVKLRECSRMLLYLKYLGRGPPGAVSEVGGDDELPLLFLDHAPRTQREGGGFACTHPTLLVLEKGLHWSLAPLFVERDF